MDGSTSIVTRLWGGVYRRNVMVQVMAWHDFLPISPIVLGMVGSAAMSHAEEISHRRTRGYTAAFAYGSVVLTSFSTFFLDDHFYRAAYWVPVVFALGALYVALGVLWSWEGARRGFTYYAIQVAIVIAIVLLCPVRGFMGIVVLPTLSQAIFDLPRWAAAIIGTLLLALVAGVWMETNGWHGVLHAFFSYAAAFVFTIAFTLTTKQAILSRVRETKLRQEVETANAQLRAYAAQADELATTRERNRLAREIHDGVGHYLTVVKTQLDAAVALLPRQPDRAREVVVKASKLTGDALDDVRRSVGTLRADAAQLPLPERLRALTQEGDLPVAIRVEGTARPLAPAVEHALFRSAQEGLTNVRKHAAATTVEMTLDFRPVDRVTLAIRDNGRGVRVGGSPGFGLQGIRERIEVLGGWVESGNRSEGGFMLTVELPA